MEVSDRIFSEQSIKEIERGLGLSVKQYSLFLFFMEGIFFDYFHVDFDMDIDECKFPKECVTEVWKIIQKLVLSEKFSKKEQKDFRAIQVFIQTYYPSAVECCYDDNAERRW